MNKTLLSILISVVFFIAGLDSVVAQINFRFVQSSAPVENLDDAIALLNGQNVEFERNCNAPVLDLVDNFGGSEPGLFRYDLNLLGDPEQPDDDFAIEINASIEINNAGTYTFGINLDDGGQIQIDFGNGFETIVERQNIGGTEDFYGQATFSTAGDFPIKIVYWDRFFQGNFEAYSAFGAFTEFDDSMRLIGDVNNGGLRVFDKSSSGDINCDGEVDFLDIAPFISLLSGN